MKILAGKLQLPQPVLCAICQQPIDQSSGEWLQIIFAGSDNVIHFHTHCYYKGDANYRYGNN